MINSVNICEYFAAVAIIIGSVVKRRANAGAQNGVARVNITVYVVATA